MAAVLPDPIGSAGAAPDHAGQAGAPRRPQVEQLNAALLGKLGEDKLLRGRKLRVDTTVVEADIDYPTDAALPYRAQAALTAELGRRAGRGFRSSAACVWPLSAALANGRPILFLTMNPIAAAAWMPSN
jgi:hypothetical protein